MTTSSSEKVQCTRISPSAVLDDRLEGQDLEWARDHLRRCDECRERVEDFQDMRMRVERLPIAPVGPAAIDAAFEAATAGAIKSPRAAVAPRREPVSPELRPAEPPRSVISAPSAAAHVVDVTSHSPAREVADTPDLLSDLEREIFRDTPWERTPRGLPPIPAATKIEPPELGAVPQPALFDADLEPYRYSAAARTRSELDLEDEGDFTLNAPRDRRADTVMRIAVGLGAAACVLLAAILYQSGWFHKTVANATPRPSVTASARPSATPSPSATPVASAPIVPVVAVLGTGAVGDNVLRVRHHPLAGYTQVVFDLQNSALPTMVITRPDSLHLVVTFKNTSSAGLPAASIGSVQVTGVEAGVQQGPDLLVTVDLAGPDRVVAYTLLPGSGHPRRLVLELYTS